MILNQTLLEIHLGNDEIQKEIFNLLFPTPSYLLHGR